MRIVLKELERVIAYIRKNSGNEHLIIKCDEFNKKLEIMVSDLESKNMTIIIHDESTSILADIIKSSKL